MKQALIIAALLAAPLAAQAEGVYLGANLGRAEQKVYAAPASLKESSTAYKVYGGYQADQYYGIEAGYADLGKVDISGGGASVAAEPKVVYLALTGSVALDSQFTVFGKLGAGRSNAKISARQGARYDSVSDHQTTGVFGAGLAYAFSPKLSFVLEYENFGKVAKDDYSNLKVDMVSAGVRYKF